MSVTIYGLPLTRAGRCIWAAEELGIGYSLQAVDMFAGEHKMPDFLAINPNGKLPAMTDGDVTLFESLAINLYLAETYGKGSLQPDDDHGRFLTNQWSIWVMAECEPILLHALLHTLGIMGFDKSPEKVAEKRAELEPKLAVLDISLEGQDYLLGDRFTIADLNVASVFQWGAAAGMDWAPHANAKAWLERCFDRPACKTVGEMVAADMARLG